MAESLEVQIKRLKEELWKKQVSLDSDVRKAVGDWYDKKSVVDNKTFGQSYREGRMRWLENASEAVKCVELGHADISWRFPYFLSEYTQPLDLDFIADVVSATRKVANIPWRYDELPPSELTNWNVLREKRPMYQHKIDALGAEQRVYKLEGSLTDLLITETIGDESREVHAIFKAKLNPEQMATFKKMADIDDFYQRPNFLAGSFLKEQGVIDMSPLHIDNDHFYNYETDHKLKHFY